MKKNGFVCILYHVLVAFTPFRPAGVASVRFEKVNHFNEPYDSFESVEFSS